jgi:hypothetical protein
MLDWVRRAFRGERGALVLASAVQLWWCLSVPVFAQEAYYWCYAKHPALSYHDHPPMIAWWIWLGSRLLGNGAIGLRLLTWLGGIGTTLAGLSLLRSFGVDARGRIAWIACTVAIPGLLLSRLLATPDAPLVLFWTLTLVALWRARGGGFGWWALAGLSAGAALTSKYTAIFLLAGGLIVMFSDKAMRAQWRRPGPYVAVALAALVFSPVIVWNVATDFESFRFQTASRFARHSFGLHWVVQAVLGQFLMIHPFVACLIPFALPWLIRRARRDDRVLWMLAFGLPLPAYLLVNSFWIQVKVNWFLPAFVPALLGGILWWRESNYVARNPRWSGLVRKSVIALPLLLVPGAPLARVFPTVGGSSWHGWNDIAKRAEFWEEQIDARDGIEGNVFFFCAGYRDAAQLSLALARVSESTGREDVIEPTLSDNVRGDTALQFDHWDRPAGRVGQDAIFVLGDPRGQSKEVPRLRRYFEEMTLVEHVEIRRFGIPLFDAEIYTCSGYRGPAPAQRE